MKQHPEQQHLTDEYVEKLVEAEQEQFALALKSLSGAPLPNGQGAVVTPAL